MPAQVSQALVAGSGVLVSREDLHNRLWPGATAGDFEQGLNTCVNKLRQKLGDSANHPRYVETVAGAGYRFIAPTNPMHRGVLELVPAATISDSRPQPLQRRFWRWRVAVVAPLAFLDRKRVV